MKKLIPLILIFIVSVSTSCDSANSDEEPFYTIKLVNQTDFEFDIYYSPTTEIENFVSGGSVTGFGETSIADLEYDVTYTIRAVGVGGGPDNYIIQEQTINTDTSVPEITVNLQFQF